MRRLRHRMRIARLLDRLPWTCWTALVCWAQLGAPLRECGITSGCRADAEQLGACFCMKLGVRTVDPLAPDEEGGS